MKVNIQFINMPTSESLEIYITNKVTLLTAKYQDIIHTDVFIKKENDKKGIGKICEMELSLSGPRMHASSNQKNYELAVKSTIKDLEKQLKKRKNLLITNR